MSCRLFHYRLMRFYCLLIFFFVNKFWMIRQIICEEPGTAFTVNTSHIIGDKKVFSSDCWWCMVNLICNISLFTEYVNSSVKHLSHWPTTTRSSAAHWLSHDWILWDSWPDEDVLRQLFHEKTNIKIRQPATPAPQSREIFRPVIISSLVGETAKKTLNSQEE